MDWHHPLNEGFGLEWAGLVLGLGQLNLFFTALVGGGDEVVLYRECWFVVLSDHGGVGSVLVQFAGVGIVLQFHRE